MKFEKDMPKSSQNKITNIRSFLKKTLLLIAFVQILIWIFVLLLYLGISILIVQVIGLLVILCTFMATLWWHRSKLMYQNTEIWYSIVKRTFDISLALIGLTVLSPVFLICAILAKFQSPGPIFYRARRVGRNEEIFLMYKFRTMVVNAESLGSSLTTYKDPRITPIGNFLRRTKLDELPQLLNVLKGDMSIIGPRPEAPAYVKYYTEEQRKILSVRPGISGLAQLDNRNEDLKLKEQSDPEGYYITQLLPEKLSIDLYYIQNQSLVLDLKIMLKTIVAMMRET